MTREQAREQKWLKEHNGFTKEECTSYFVSINDCERKEVSLQKMISYVVNTPKTKSILVTDKLTGGKIYERNTQGNEYCSNFFYDIFERHRQQKREKRNNKKAGE